ncbi:hypothetical protein RBG61_05350 [Paludicola sp. MB14-C6]|uniref:hypothetical protein n=1 Tax=Paludihabitans sp. MB14-C6 TaxID=3070656 RepID=UPI0027DBCC5A|nr:hypothetical protein [Paludicola sp. MB14-C6]WMJ24090.1 hypothetical protein RBG61_05350 [Paludicola sp. MB14-C6]
MKTRLNNNNKLENGEADASFYPTSSKTEGSNENTSTESEHSIAIEENSIYRRFDGGSKLTNLFGKRCYELIEGTNESELVKVLDMIDDLTQLYNVGQYPYKKGDKVDLGGHVLQLARGENAQNVFSVFSARAADWINKYPKTDTFIGAQENYVEKKYVDEVIDRYFCIDRQNITFDGIRQNYIQEEDVYTFPSIGKDVDTLPILLSYEEKQNKIECVFSFVSHSLVYHDSKLLIEVEEGSTIPIGKFQVSKRTLPELGEVNYAQPYISLQDQKKLNKVKFIFCKDGNNLKIHSIEYV